MSNCTITLQHIGNFASTHADLLPLSGVGGYTNEPLLSLCNDALSELLTSPNDWKFNSVEMPMLVTAKNKQDYLFAGATAFTLGSTSTGAAVSMTGVAVSGGVVTITTLEPHRFAVSDTVYLTGIVMTTGTTSVYNSTFTDNGDTSTWTGGWTIASVPSTTTFTFAKTTGQNNSDAGGAPGITDFGWLTNAAMVEMNNTSSPLPIRFLTAVKDLPLRSDIAHPDKVSMYRDYGTGVLKLRFKEVPGATIWGVKLVYQAKAPLKAALTETWAPFPDHYSAVYRQAVLYRMYRYLGSTKADGEFQKLQIEIQRAQGADDAEASEIFVCPDETWAGF